MGSALLARWCQRIDARFTVVTPSPKTLPRGVAHACDPADLRDQVFDVVVVAVKPQMIEEVAPDYVGRIAPDGMVLSIAAGTSADRLATVFDCPRVVRLMPNLPVMIGAGVSGLHAADACNNEHRELASRFAEEVGLALWVDDEDEIDRITALAGSGPGYVFEIARVYAQAAERLGFDAVSARKLVLQTMLGTIEMALASDESLETLRNNVMSRKGTTEAGIAALTRDGQLEALMQNTVEAAYRRAVELR